MANIESENSLPHDSAKPSINVGIEIIEPDLADFESVSQIDNYKLLKTVVDDDYAIYAAVEDGIENRNLGLESSRSTKDHPSLISGYWKHSMPIDGFLNQTDSFFAQHATLDPQHLKDVHITISGNKTILDAEGIRPITKQDLVAGNEEEIGEKAESLRFLRVENDIIAFTWSPEEVGFILSQGLFPDKTGLRSSLSNFYTSTEPDVPTVVFNKALEIVSTDKFQNPPKQ